LMADLGIVGSIGIMIVAATLVILLRGGPT
jgi:hypothetical protein